MVKKLLLVCGFALMLTGCDKPKIDASTPETMQESMQKVRESLTEAQRQEFTDAATTVVMNSIDLKALMAGNFSGDGDAIANLQAEKTKEALNGKTGEEIIKEAKAIESKRAEEKKQQALQEIAALKDKQSKALKAKEGLKPFVITKGGFSFRKYEYGGSKPVINISVKNGTNASISTVYFLGKIASPDRSVPWLVDGFSYSIPGGLEPGEKGDWALEPAMGSAWYTFKAPEDAIFTVQVMRLDGPDGKVLFDAGEFSDEDQKRLDMLQAKYGTH